MDLIEKYLGEAKGEYIHIINSNNEWEVMHSSHNHPSMGGQVLKTFNNGGDAVKFARKTFSSIKGVKIWKQTGHGANAKWKDETHGGMNKIFQQGAI